ncbi:patatin-like phospholipase family protein [Bradyrhizobium erythrophlei]|uniref:NTE family protein n=1 Tax=Bradyrhizobium erythrophlei TaxID=1437360 RepID=A0A1M7TRI6_9BRAD|nr:patatin-like phospholipase family protein [Bradyrhizobium erythrophlei]SHN73367.1 NTE family protein [Bradyrhizobium erythrophlei]
MLPADQKKHHCTEGRPPFECIALLLQGGGALGAYQAGVYEALVQSGIHPDWVAGISIGAINSALIAGNPPERRVEKLREFWERVTSDVFGSWPQDFLTPLAKGDWVRGLMNQISANSAMLSGASGFFAPRLLSPWLHPTGSIEATSFYDASALRSTLESLVDFDRINAREMRFSVGAVNVRSGNFVYFDSTTHTIRPEHVMASGALPPAFAAVEIDGERYWDGGLISNTPLQWVLDSTPRQDTLAFQVDLWSARGDFPGNMAEVETRQKEIQYSSRTRANTDQFKRAQRIRNTVAALLESLPDNLKDEPNAKLLGSIAGRKVYNMVHLIYRAKNYEGNSKDYEFSRSSMETHWRAGYQDTVRTLRHPNVLKRPANHESVAVFDLERDGRD